MSKFNKILLSVLLFITVVGFIAVKYSDINLFTVMAAISDIKEVDTPKDTVQKEKEVKKHQDIIIRNKHTAPNDIPPLILTHSPSTIVGIGDSLTQGVGSDIEDGYIGRLNNHYSNQGIELTSINLAKKGKRSEQLLAELETEEYLEDIQKADVVFLTIGGNDIMKIVKKHMMKVTADLVAEARKPYEANLNQSLKLIREMNPHARIYIVGIYNPFIDLFPDKPAITSEANNWNMIMERTSRKHSNTFYIPIDDLFLHDLDSKLYRDMFHPNDKGYDIIAERINKYFILQQDEKNISNTN